MNWFQRFWKALTESMPGKEGIAVTPLTNFTPRAQQVLALARTEAARLNHNFLGTEHLLLGLIKLGQGVAVNVLEKMGVDLENARAEVEKYVGTGPKEKQWGTFPYTPRVKKVIALANKERQSLNHTYLGTEHLLLGLLHEDDSVAARVMVNLGVDLLKARQEILLELDPNFAPHTDDGTKSLTPKEAPPMSSKFETPQNPEPARLKQDSIDTSKRYDVYCNERNQEVVVYRNVLFKGIKTLFQTRQYQFMSEFMELEQADGRILFIARSSVIKFCEHGITPCTETISNKNPAG